MALTAKVFTIVVPIRFIDHNLAGVEKSALLALHDRNFSESAVHIALATSTNRADWSFAKINGHR